MVAVRGEFQARKMRPDSDIEVLIASEASWRAERPVDDNTIS